MVVVAISHQHCTSSNSNQNIDLPVEVMNLGMLHSLHLVVRHDCGLGFEVVLRKDCTNYCTRDVGRRRKEDCVLISREAEQSGQVKQVLQKNIQGLYNRLGSKGAGGSAVGPGILHLPDSAFEKTIEDCNSLKKVFRTYCLALEALLYQSPRNSA